MRSRPDALLLDEVFSPQIAVMLGDAGIDCASAAADPALRALDHGAIADAALARRRVLVTNNVVDIETIRRDRLARGLGMPNLIYTDDATFPRKRGWVGRLVVALAYASTEQLTEAHGGVLWLSAPPSR